MSAILIKCYNILKFLMHLSATRTIRVAIFFSIKHIFFAIITMSLIAMAALCLMISITIKPPPYHITAYNADDGIKTCDGKVLAR